MSTPHDNSPLGVTGALTSVDGERYYRITHVERMEPFLISVVSDTDLWMWASSNGALTAGRVDADHALFPYLTEDRLHRLAQHCGAVSVLVRVHTAQREVWRPMSAEVPARGVRSVYKHVTGNRVIFEEYHPEWRVHYRVSWMPSSRFGWVREVEVTNRGKSEVALDIVDGLLDIMPAGIDLMTELRFSNLADAYKRSEYCPGGGAALYTLESNIIDRAEPSESLLATAVWSAGQPFTELHLDERVVRATIDDRSVAAPTPLVVGRAGAYLLRGSQRIGADGSIKWITVVDTNLDHAAVCERLSAIAHPNVYQTVMDDAAAGGRRLSELLAKADGFQTTGEEVADAHHLSNVLFNSMRGGLFLYGYQFPVADLLDFLRQRNTTVFERHHDGVVSWGEWGNTARLVAYARREHDWELERLALEYLPLTFSRRHGDPSRPWNRFSINVHNKEGDEILFYQGNWRDIFQNWEATLYSFPLYTPDVVAKFVNASTVDGYNPYRINRNGIDWEILNDADPWSNIGYWGDHQIVYLLRLLENWERFEPGAVLEWLDRPIFSYADVPYRLARHRDILRDPQHTITYDHQRAETVSRRVHERGADGRLVVDSKGAIVQVGLLEKLIVPALAKITAVVPGGGIWMNTQRPEWNDANNALAGYGLSMVTLYYLRRYLDFVRLRLSERSARTVPLSGAVAQWMHQQHEALVHWSDLAGAAAAPVPGDDTAPRTAPTDTTRRQFIDTMGEIGERYRERVYTRFDATVSEIECRAVAQWCQSALHLLDATIATARRSDGLYHSYNLIDVSSDQVATVAHLPLMLEGQVAILSSGTLTDQEATALVEALFESELYRADQNSFVLYPARIPKSFIERNTLSADDVALHPVLQEVGIVGSILHPDREGALHFDATLHNAAALRNFPAYSKLERPQRRALLELYEQTFCHHSFTGRSGSMHGYEGIGSIYWHMVGKLLLAVQECYWSAKERDTDRPAVERLRRCYHRVRTGLGFRKHPVHFGAFPTDCYSHTPSHSGAQQPGMTGQVKEGILCRWGELGVRIRNGCISLECGLLSDQEYFPAEGHGTTTFTLCGTAFEVRAGTEHTIEVHTRDGQRAHYQGTTLPHSESREIFQRSGSVVRVIFRVGRNTRTV